MTFYSQEHDVLLVLANYPYISDKSLVPVLLDYGISGQSSFIVPTNQSVGSLRPQLLKQRQSSNPKPQRRPSPHKAQHVVMLETSGKNFVISTNWQLIKPQFSKNSKPNVNWMLSSCHELKRILTKSWKWIFPFWSHWCCSCSSSRSSCSTCHGGCDGWSGCG